MKKIIFVVCIGVILLCGLTLAGCNKASVTQIEVLQLPDKSSYYIGESADWTGCLLGVTYNDGSSEEVPVTDDMVTGFDTSSIGPKTVIVRYTANNREYVTSMLLHVVARPPSKLEVAKMPDKSEYVVGETVDLTGILVNVYYTETQVMQVGLVDLVYTAKTVSVDTTGVKVSFGQLSVMVPITVVPETVVALRAQCGEDNTLYYNQWLYPGLFEGYFVYNTGKEERVQTLAIREDATRVSVLGEMTVHLTATHQQFGEFETTVIVQVQRDKIQTIAVDSATQSCQVGDAFRWADVRLNVTMAHSAIQGTLAALAAPLGIVADVADGTVWQQEKAETVRIYDEAGDEQVQLVVAVGVVALVRLEATQAEKVVQCDEGTVPTPTATLLYAVYSDDATTEGGHRVLVWNRWRVADGVTVELPAPCAKGDTHATLTYQGLSYTFAISVLPIS